MEYAENQILKKFQIQILHAKNKSLRDFALPCTTNSKLNLISNNMIHEYEFNPKEERQKYLYNHLNMNEEQIFVTDEIIDSIDKQKNNYYFLKAPAGMSKTYTFNTILHYCKVNGYLGLPVATSGIVALLFPNGRIINNRFRLIPLIDATSMTQIPIHTKNQLYKLIKQSKVIT